MTKEDQILEILHEHTKLLNVCVHTLDEHSRILNEHSKKIAELSETVTQLSEKVNQLSEMVTEHTYILLDHSERIDKLTKRFSALEEKVDSMHQTLILLEVDFSDKSTILFDGHTMHQEHFEKNDKHIEGLQETARDHSNRLISLEINSKKHTKQLERLSSK